MTVTQTRRLPKYLITYLGRYHPTYLVACWFLVYSRRAALSPPSVSSSSAHSKLHSGGFGRPIHSQTGLCCWHLFWLPSMHIHTPSWALWLCWWAIGNEVCLSPNPPHGPVIQGYRARDLVRQAGRSQLAPAACARGAANQMVRRIEACLRCSSLEPTKDCRGLAR